MITLPDREYAKTAEQWVAVACAKTPTLFTNLIHVQDGVMYATDRHRLHWTDTIFPNGVYTPDFMPAKLFDDRVPNFSAYIRAAVNQVSLEEMYVGYQGRKKLELARVPDSIGVKIEYLYDAVNGDPKPNLYHDVMGLTGVIDFGKFMIAKMGGA